MRKDRPFISRNWELVPYDFSVAWWPRSWKRVGLIQRLILCAYLIWALLVSACADFSAATRNNSGVTTTCVDRDLHDGDSCQGLSAPTTMPE